MSRKFRGNVSISLLAVQMAVLMYSENIGVYY